VEGVQQLLEANMVTDLNM